MKTAIIILLGLLAACIDIQAQAPKSNYTGKAAVAGLGTIAFPEGEWSLEFQRIHAPTNDLHVPDYFVFKRVGDRLERLTFLRYPPTTTPRQLGHMLDTVGETMGDGLPWELKNAASRSGGVIHPLRVEPPVPSATERHVTFSFIHVHPSPAPSWLCHAFLFSHDSSAFVIAHSSTSVISPEDVQDVKSRSQFSRITKTPRDR
ncbi:MAG: hypothetical protein LR011_13975 [Verrucomicrobia bacterium]|nr:hypothetical protein [Verrucomicrobiota bacterium]